MARNLRLLEHTSGARYGNRMVAIGNLVAQGAWGCKDIPVSKIAPDKGSSVDGIVATLGVPRFLLDLRPAPPNVRNWLDRPNVLWDGAGTLSLTPGKAFDILLFLGTITPACPS